MTSTSSLRPTNRDAVLKIQRELNARPGAPKLKEDGILGKKTKAAIDGFEQRHGGKLDALMTDGFEPGVKPTGDAAKAEVLALQRELNARPGAKALEEDGVLGPKTKRALDAFTKKTGSIDKLFTDGFEPGAAKAKDPAEGPGATKAEALTGSTQQKLDALNERMDEKGLVRGKKSTCVKTVRRNLQRLGLGAGVPESTGGDTNNHVRGMMTQMVESGKWKTLSLPGSEEKTIKGAYGTIKAQVLSKSEYLAAMKAGQVPDGALVFSTKHGWSSGRGPLGHDVAINRDGKLFNFKDMGGPLVYRNTKEVVIMVPN